MASTTQGTIDDPKGGVAKVTCPTFEAMGQIPVFHRTYFLFGYNSGFSWSIFILFAPVETGRNTTKRLIKFCLTHYK